MIFKFTIVPTEKESTIVIVSISVIDGKGYFIKILNLTEPKTQIGARIDKIR